MFLNEFKFQHICLN